MLKLPGDLTPARFLKQYWQKQPLFMPRALDKLRPSITRNELAWLATQEDVESRLVFIDGSARNRSVYRIETGPFDPQYLAQLPKRNWTLLVHDVEKHLPAMRGLFREVPFIPDWRIDDLMVSFAAPGGGVGPHRDNYDVFLCQGIGTRNWRVSDAPVSENPAASRDLVLLEEFDCGEAHDTVAGDVLYLPPGVAHWGTASRACITYSIGMRAPQISDLLVDPGLRTPGADLFYEDPDLGVDEAIPGYISPAATRRAMHLLGLSESQHRDVAIALGKFSTQLKDWLQPDCPTDDEVVALLEVLNQGGTMTVHGMSRIAYDDQTLFVNGHHTDLPGEGWTLVRQVSENRRLRLRKGHESANSGIIAWMLDHGAFEIPDDL